MPNRSATGPRTATTRLGLWGMRGFYLLYYAAMAALLPFLTLYYQECGLSGSQIGVLAAIPPVLVVLAAAAWGALADRSGRHRLVLAVAIAGAGVCAVALGQLRTFVLLVPAVFGLALFMAPIPSLADNAVLELLADRRDRYGRVRLWGAIGWGACAPLAGRLVEGAGLGRAFWVFAAMMGGLLLVALGAVRPPGSGGPKDRGGLLRLVRQPGWAYFVAVAFVGGCGLGFAHHYLFLYMQAVGASRTSMGLALSIATVSELVLFYLTDRLIGRWGVRRVLFAGMVVSGIRLLLYATTGDTRLILAIQLLHGPAFAMVWTAGVACASRLSPPGMGATAQGLYSGINYGLAGGAGALIGGWLLDYMAPQAMYAWAGAGVLGLVVVLLLAGRGHALDLAPVHSGTLPAGPDPG